jgi:hypothetical protein
MKIESHLRALASWLTVTMALWSMVYYYGYGTQEGSDWILGDLTVPVS